jgi:hypothetical protein
MATSRNFIHPISDYGADTHGMGRDQNIHREDESALYVEVSVQDMRRLLAGDPDPELRERLQDEIDRELERLHDRRNWG